MSDAAKIVVGLAIPPAFVAVAIYAPSVLLVLFVLLVWFGLSAFIICSFFEGQS